MAKSNTPSAKVLKIENNPPEKCPKCGAATGIYDGGRAWCCDSCGECNDAYRRLNEQLEAYARTPEVIAANARLKARLKAGMEEINRNLKTVGAESKIEDSDWSELRAIARIDFGLTYEEFWRLTPREFNDLLKRLNRKAALAAKTSTPGRYAAEWSSVPDWSSQLKRLIRSGLNTIKNRGNNEELRRWMIQNAPDDKIKAKVATRDKRRKHVVDVAINEVRKAMGIPAAN